MKIIAIDNFDRDRVRDVLIAENVHANYIDEIVELLQKKHGGNYASYYYTARPDDYVLSRGMEDLV